MEADAAPARMTRQAKLLRNDGAGYCREVVAASTNCTNAEFGRNTEYRSRIGIITIFESISEPVTDVARPVSTSEYLVA